MMLRLFPNLFSRENKKSTNNGVMAWSACNVLNPEVGGVRADGETVIGSNCRFRNLVQRGYKLTNLKLYFNDTQSSKFTGQN